MTRRAYPVRASADGGAEERDLLPALGRILLVEDNEEHATIIERAFSPGAAAASPQVTVVSTIAAASEAIAEHPYDLVISDLRLPDGEGLDLLSRRPRLPLLMMTSHGTELIAVEAMKRGVLDYIVKSESTLIEMPRIASRAWRLWSNIVAKEEAEASLRESLTEKTTLLKEVHHRVKNNLQVVCSLLSMQIECTRAEQDVRPLSDAHSRVLAMSLIHEQIYRSETLSRLDFGAYVEELSAQLFQAYSVDPARLRLETSIDAVQLTVNDAVPCGLIINELISNALKHAFRDGRQGIVRVSLKTTVSDETDGKLIELKVGDNGPGLPAALHIERSSSLGFQIVSTLIRQLRADLAVSRKGGTTFAISWRLPR